MAFVMVIVALGFGYGFSNANPDGVLLHAPSQAPLHAPLEQADATATGETGNAVAEAGSSESRVNTATGKDVAPDRRNGFAFGASIGLLATCLAYSVVLLASMIRAGSQQRRPGTWCYLLAVLIALGFVASYVLDTQFS